MRLSGISVKVGNVMARLVAVRVLPYQTRDIRRSIRRLSGAGAKDAVELRRQLFASAHQLAQTNRIMLDREGRLPRVGFRKIPPFAGISHLVTGERFCPFSVG